MFKLIDLTDEQIHAVLIRLENIAEDLDSARYWMTNSKAYGIIHARRLYYDAKLFYDDLVKHLETNDIESITRGNGKLIELHEMKFGGGDKTLKIKLP